MGVSQSFEDLNFAVKILLELLVQSLEIYRLNCNGCFRLLIANVSP